MRLLQDCLTVVLAATSVSGPVRADTRDVHSPADKPIRLRLALRDADLYALGFKNTLQ